MDKKAQGLSTNTIILIILGVIVLVVLIIGFTVGWGGIRDWIAPSNNVKSIVDKCNIVCSTEQKYSYCYEGRKLKAEDETIEDISCYVLAKEKSVYGIGTCPGINCEIFDTENDAIGNCSSEGKEVFYLEGLTMGSYTCEEADVVVPPEEPIE